MDIVNKRSGSKVMDVGSLRAVLDQMPVNDERIVPAIVFKPDDEQKHFEIADGCVYVNVKIMPWETPVRARLGSGIGGPDRGVWLIPPVGSEVVLWAHMGDLAASPVIIAHTSSGTVPDALDETTLVVKSSKAIRIIAVDGDVSVEAPNGIVKLNGNDQPVARKTDPVDMGTWVHVPAAGVGVTACSLSWVPTTTTVPPTTPTVITLGSALTGAIKDGSTKVKAG